MQNYVAHYFPTNQYGVRPIPHGPDLPLPSPPTSLNVSSNSDVGLNSENEDQKYGMNSKGLQKLFK